MTVFPILAYNPTTKNLKLVFDTQITAENALADTDMAGYTVFRRRGYLLTDVAGSIIAGTYDELSDGALEFNSATRSNVYNGNGTGYVVTRAGLSVSSPFGIKCLYKFRWRAYDSGEVYVRFTNSDEVDTAALDTNFDMSVYHLTTGYMEKIINEDGLFYMRFQNTLTGFTIQEVGCVDYNLD
jgi:hypothetical protein